jgi:DNA-binding NarL/FixJ family response regulator
MIQVILISELEKDREKINSILSDQNDFELRGLGSNGYDALKYAMDFTPDVEILDMEKNDALLELTPLIKRKSPSTALIVLGSRYKNGDASRALEAGALGYLLKETDMERLAVSVRTVFSGVYYISPCIMKKAFNFILEMNKFPSVYSYFLLVREKYKTIPDSVSRMERQIMSLIGCGMTVREIADKLKLKPGTLRNYLSVIMRKVNIKNRTNLVLYAIRHGLVDYAREKS